MTHWLDTQVRLVSSRFSQVNSNRGIYPVSASAFYNHVSQHTDTQTHAHTPIHEYTQTHHTAINNFKINNSDTNTDTFILYIYSPGTTRTQRHHQGGQGEKRGEGPSEATLGHCGRLTTETLEPTQGRMEGQRMSW